MKLEKSHLDFKIELKVLTDEDPGTFEGHASVFGKLDAHSDIVMRGSFKESLAEHEELGTFPHLLWQHDTRNPVGLWIQMKEDRKGLYVKGKLLIDDIVDARRAHALLKADVPLGLSIGFSTVEAEFDEKRGIRKIRKVKLWEVSLVTFPALDSARIESVKTIVPFENLPLANLDAPWIRSQAEARVREWAGVTEEANLKYRSAFAWYDKSDVKNFNSYKLQIADVVDGELVAVPKAIRSAASLLMGVKGDLGILEHDNQSVLNYISRYYGKMRDEFDAEDIIPPWERSMEELPLAIKDVLSEIVYCIETKRDYENHLRDEGFSSAAAKSITSSGYRDRMEPRDEAVGLSELLESLKLAGKIVTT